MNDMFIVMQDMVDICWLMFVDVLMLNDYVLCEEVLNWLYEKVKVVQWDVVIDVDWCYDFDLVNLFGMFDLIFLIYGIELWGKLVDVDKCEVCYYVQGWLLLQILYGEQVVLICVLKFVLVENGLSVWLCVVVQMMDEVCYVEVYVKFVNEKFDVSYLMSCLLKGLLYDMIMSSVFDMMNFGMQVLVEGIVLLIFQSVVVYSIDLFIKDLFL